MLSGLCLHSRSAPQEEEINPASALNSTYVADVSPVLNRGFSSLMPNGSTIAVVLSDKGQNQQLDVASRFVTLPLASRV